MRGPRGSITCVFGFQGLCKAWTCESAGKSLEVQDVGFAASVLRIRGSGDLSFDEERGFEESGSEGRFGVDIRVGPFGWEDDVCAEQFA